jgi:hypothetical protein
MQKYFCLYIYNVSQPNFYPSTAKFFKKGSGRAEIARRVGFIRGPTAYARIMHVLHERPLNYQIYRFGRINAPLDKFYLLWSNQAGCNPSTHLDGLWH